MKNYEVLEDIEINGTQYTAGDTVELNDEDAAGPVGEAKIKEVAPKDAGEEA